jgi:hypothetical protein
MKKFISGMFLLMSMHGWGQIDTVFLSQEKLADTIYHKLASKAPTGYLANKLSLLPSDSLLLKTNKYLGDSSNYRVDADKMVQWLYEMNHIAVKPNALPHMDSIFDQAYSYVGEMEFEEEIIVVPLGIFDLTFNSVDEQTGLSNGILGKDVSIWKDLDSTDLSIVSTHYSSLSGPLFDYQSSDRMGLVVKSDFFISNTRSITDVQQLELWRNGNWKTVDFDQIALFTPAYDSVQQFKIRIYYTDNTVAIYSFLINTPEIVDEPKEKDIFDAEEWEDDPDAYGNDCSFLNLQSSWSPGCTSCGMKEKNGNKIKWCFIPSCSRAGFDDEQPEKPYILVTGYRPPMFGQSFKKTWKLYSVQHQNLLENLRGQDYDIILVKFNIAAKPDKHGMEESAALFEEFLIHLNMNMKKGDYFENIIQGSSMGEEIARLTLLRMEQKHMDYSQNYPHHHSRLNISYDANFFGANIPLAYQYQIYSEHYHKSNYLGFVNWFLSWFLHKTVTQKTFKELVTYHADNDDENIFLWPIDVRGYREPTHHWRRQGFYNALNAVDNGQHIFPMPIATRNIGISLGKFAGKNSDGTEEYNNAGEYWQNISVLGYNFRLGTAKYMPSGQTFKIFERQIPPLFFFNPFQTIVKNEVNVSLMQEIDNVAGSFLDGVGNIIDVGNRTYFPLTPATLFGGKSFFSHKSVVTALGINPNLWPSDGSMAVNVQDLGLMYSTFEGLQNNQKSNHFGYPNLGRPNDHFQVTPFEAIYIDDEIDAHIVLKESTTAYVDSLNNFIYSEAEPWYLGLQNQVVGSRARLNYQYYVRRRARNVITVGHLVTPATDPGDYVTQENATVDLRAGQEINLKPGVHFQSGSSVHLKIEFERCPDSNNKSAASSNPGETEESPDDLLRDPFGSFEKKLAVLYPNPTNNGLFSLKSHSEVVISTIRVYTVYGNVLDEIKDINETEYHSRKALPTGTYLIRVEFGPKIETYKLIVL